MSRRRLVILGIILLVLLSVIALGVGNHSAEKRTFGKLTVNVQNPWLGGNDVYYYTGSFFAKYDAQNNSIDRLSDYLFIQSGVSSVNWAPNAVVFQTNPSSGDRDDVTTAAGQLGAKPYQPHWWKYDFQTKQYELIALPGADDCVSITQINSLQLACLAPQASGDSSTVLKIFDLSSGTSTNIFSTDDDVSNITSDGQKVYFLLARLSGSQSLHSAGLSTKPQELYSSNGLLTYYVYGKGRVLINETSNNPKVVSAQDTHESPTAIKQKLVLVEGSKTTWSKNIKSLPISFFTDSSGDMLFSSLDGSIKSVDAKGIKTVDKPAVPVLGLGDFLFTASHKLYKLSGNGELSSSPAMSRGINKKYPSGFSTKNDNDKAGNSFIDVAGGGKQNVYIFVPNIPSSQQELAVGTMLEQKGFKPSEFNFAWKVDSVGFQAPISPNAIVIK
jgi:hypothetical protein